MKQMGRKRVMLACVCCMGLLWMTACSGEKTVAENGLQAGAAAETQGTAASIKGSGGSVADEPGGLNADAGGGQGGITDTQQADGKKEGYVFKDSGSSQLKEENVRNLDYRLLYLARNEIFARHGYLFKDEGLQKYFGAKSWYIKDAAFDNQISEVEKYNVELIQKYETARKEASQAVNESKAARFDLDGDGKLEEIRYKLSDGSDFTLSIGGITVQGSGFDVEDTFHIVDLDIMDGIKEIAVQEFGPSDDYKTTFYAYRGGKVIPLGQVQGLCGDYRRLPGDGRVIAETRFQVLQTWFYEDEYRLNNQHVLEHVAKPLYLSSYKDQYLTVKKPLILYKEPDSKEAAIQASKGEKLLLVGSDDREWCCVTDAHGVKGWFAVEGFQQVRELGMPAGEVFDGLSFAD